MKGAVAIIVIVILLFAGFIAMIQTQREEAEKKYTFADVLNDYTINSAENEAQFKNFKIGDTIKITDTILDVFVIESNQTDVNASTGIFLKSVGKGNHSLFGTPIGLGFEGNKSSEYMVGKKVTIKVKVTGKDALHESLDEIALFFELYEAYQ